MGEIPVCPEYIAQKRGIPDQEWQLFPAMAGQQRMPAGSGYAGVAGQGVWLPSGHRARVTGRLLPGR